MLVAEGDPQVSAPTICITLSCIVIQKENKCVILILKLAESLLSEAAVWLEYSNK
jgi:hypothetical protein